MGKVAKITRSRHQDARNKRDQRAQRSKAVREKRLGIDNEGRKLQHVVAQRRLPSEADSKLLLSQFAQACRLPAPCTDLCLLIRHCAGISEEAGTGTASACEQAQEARGGKRVREEEDVDRSKTATLKSFANALLSTAGTPVLTVDGESGAAAGDDEDEDPMTVLLAILQNDYGRRVVVTLLDALHRTRGCEAECVEVAKVVLEQFEENEHLPKHHVACRVLSALVQFGPTDVRQGVLNLLRESCMDGRGVGALLSDRHTSVTIDNLLQTDPEETSQWLCESLGLAPVCDTAASSSSSKKTKKTATKGTKAKAEAHHGEECEGELMKMIEDPVSSHIVKKLISPANRHLLLSRLSVSTLLASKRGTSFLTALLDASAYAEDGNKSGEAALVLDSLLEQIGTRLREMAADRQGNFVVQKLFLLVPHTPAKRQGEYFALIVRLLGGAAGLQTLVSNPYGVHVMCGLVDAALQSDSAETCADEIGGLIVTKSNVVDLLNNHQGSLVVRRLMPLVKNGASSKVGRLLVSAIEQNLSSLLYDAGGNLVVQAYLRALGPGEASAFARKLKKEELVALSRNPFAAYVVGALLDTVDATTHVMLCNLLKPYVATLATHLNGRFVVEKLIPASRDVRDELVRHFSALAMGQGTQHVLCALVASLDPRGKENLIRNTIVPSVRELATNSFGSVALQKLMQSDADVLSAVQLRLHNDTALTNDLAQTFHGKFVVNLAIHGNGDKRKTHRPAQ